MMKEDFELLRGLANCQDKEQMMRYIEEHQPKPMTNSEWIRNMTDAEFAEFLGHSNLCVRIQRGSTWCEDHAICEGCLEEWLKQPAEVE